MEGPVKAIPTTYKGFRCRSRLEARWLVFFDSMEIEYQYEPEGFQTTTGERYLPDLYLPIIDAFAEIKPLAAGLHNALLKCQKFVLAGMGTKILFLVGQPDFKPYLMFHRIDLEDGIESWLTNASLDIHFKPHRYFEEHRLFEDFDGSVLEREFDFSLRYRTAVYESRWARFEDCRIA
jgi:hypothetical protein